MKIIKALLIQIYLLITVSIAQYYHTPTPSFNHFNHVNHMNHIHSMHQQMNTMLNIHSQINNNLVLFKGHNDKTDVSEEVKEIEIRYETGDRDDFEEELKGLSLFEVKYNTSQLNMLSASLNDQNSDIYIYNKDGKLLAHKDVDREGAISESTIYTYNEEGLLTEECEYDEYKPEDRKLYTYNSLKKPILIKELDEDGNIEKTIKYSYSKNNGIDTVCEYDDEGALETLELYSKGKVIESSEFDTDDGSLEDFMTFDYNSKGLLISKKDFDEDKELQEELTYKYDNNDNIIEECKYSQRGDLEKTETSEYNANGDITKKIVKDDDGDLRYSYTYTYDSSGNLVNVKKTDDDNDLVFQCNYASFDNYGNWKVKFLHAYGNPEMSRIFYRNFKYFN